MLRRSFIYKTASGRESYKDYLDSLKDRWGAAKIRARVLRAEMGNLGSHRSVGHGVVEMKINFGPGYRVYVGLQGQELMVLLCAGNKGSQQRDIAKAISYWNDYRRSYEKISNSQRLS